VDKLKILDSERGLTLRKHWRGWRWRQITWTNVEIGNEAIVATVDIF